MSVIVTVLVTGDPAVFEEQVSAQADDVARIIESAKSHGVIAHRWYGGDGELMVIDEWPDAASFNAFFEENQGAIGPLMQAVGVTSQPEVKVWRKLEAGDDVGWGA